MNHSNMEMKQIQDYLDSTDTDVLEFVEGVLKGEDKLNYITVAFLSKEAAEEIKRLTGKEVEGSRVVLDINAIHHIEKRHGINGKQDQSMRDLADIARMGYVIMNYDQIIWDGMTTPGYLDESGDHAPMIKLSKKIDGTYYVIEAVNSSKRKKNYVVTAYITKEKEQ